MTQTLWAQNATKLGEALAKRQGCNCLPIDPLKIARALDIEVEALPSDHRGVSGMLLYGGSSFGIMYATYLGNRGFENFCVAHEIGHHEIPGHPEKILVDGKHVSRAGFSAADRCELEADHFAAGLLMPSYLFDAEINRNQSGLQAVESLAHKCETSLVATAIRYAQRTPDPIAVIVSEKKSIRYCFMSDEFKEIRGLTWIKKGDLIPKDTATYRFNSHENNVLQAHRAEAETSLSDWFGCNTQFEAYEEVAGLGAYGKTLTVISLDALPTQEEHDEEDELVESWTPRFRR